MTRLRLRAAAAAAAVLACLAATALAPAVGRADATQESMLQDDNHLIYASTSTVERTLDIIASLGVQRIRVTVLWAALAPDPLSHSRPRRFDATNPADYPPSAWRPYDRILELAGRRHITVDFNVTAPGPIWAMSTNIPNETVANHWAPIEREFEQFVVALGRRYSGSYGRPGHRVPAVQTWSIYNEPNQPGWLAPQWWPARGKQVPASAILYRRYVDAAWSALKATGHLARGDMVLIGELAPEDSGGRGPYTAMAPMPFLRALYCVDGRYRPLRGQAAQQLECPSGGSAIDFAAAHPGLFYATGFAHHPYYFSQPPDARSSDPDFVPLGNLGRLEQALDRVFHAYRVGRRIPLYLTEYGYQTDPPDPYQKVSPAQQAAYLNQADYIAWRDARVRMVAQFLLYDSPPDTRYSPSQWGYWATFQTGLLFAGGRPKPAFGAYAMPIWLPTTNVSRSGRLFVWGQLRAAWQAIPQRAQIQWCPPRGRWRTLALLDVRNPSGYLTARVRLPGSGDVRIAWRSLTSRSVAVTVAR